MHFAASSLVGESMVDPQKYYVNNLAGTLALLDAMRAATATAWYSLRAARSMAMPTARRCRGLPCAPINPYGASKWMIERVLADYRGAYRLGSFALRFFNASGADPSGEIGEMRDVETHLIPRAMMALQDTCLTSRCSATIMQRPTAPRSATTSMSPTSRPPMCWR